MQTAAQEKQVFQLKGSMYTLSALHLLEVNIDLFSKQLADTVRQSPKFFQHAPIVIDLHLLKSPINSLDFQKITSEIRKLGLIPVGVRGGDEKQHVAAINTGLAVFPQEKLTKKKEEEKKKAEAKMKTKIITQPVRSGQQIQASNDMIIIAAVSNGAELLAGGSIHVYGPLRGRALAGINGDKTARIFCQSMQAELVSIAGNYLVDEKLREFATDSPTQIFLQKDTIKITVLS